MKPYIQPFERELALRELAKFAGASPETVTRTGNDYYEVTCSVHESVLVDRLAYWEIVQGTAAMWTIQVRREATASVVRNGIRPADLLRVLPFRGESIPVPSRRSLRYGPHDIHDYRGKFFPQLVRALLNLSDLESEGTVLDPMCGSGTTLVEANLSGYAAIGVDLNPLSVVISRTKCALLRANPEGLVRQYEALRDALMDRPVLRIPLACSWLEKLTQQDQYYLARWFAPNILLELDRIATLIDQMEASPARDLCWVCLSDILRTVSWQETDDLRIRRKDMLETGTDVVATFLKQLGNSVRHVVAFLLEEGGVRAPRFKVIGGDAASVLDDAKVLFKRVDAVITSPPYATALPYIDTDRLSLSFLNLLPRNLHRKLEAGMIGNREVTRRQRDALWEEYLRSKSLLPPETVALIDRVAEAYGGNDAGFRRRNLPALLAKYFLDMRVILLKLSHVTRSEGHVFLVVGNNHTVAQGTRIEIGTATHLASIGEAMGLRLVELIPMDMLTPRDIFKRNAVRSESVVHFQARS
ncbi:MAG: hypothetical protein HY675_02580 [Chloroflexi bacterium]|nr:hypothetical protein [Chloroflexota bacterium]